MPASASGQAVSRMPVSVALRPSTVWKKKGRLTKARPCAVKVQVAELIESANSGRLKTSIGIIGSASRVWRQMNSVPSSTAVPSSPRISALEWPWAMPSMPKISRPKVMPDMAADRTSNGRCTCVVCGR